MFEWVVSRVVRWGVEGAERRRKADEELREALMEQPDLPEEALEDLVDDFDPHFWFDMEHPFPGLAAAAERLRSRFGIRVLPGHFAYNDLGEGAHYELELARVEGGSERTSIGEFEARTAHAVVRQREGEDVRPLTDVTGSARFATAHLIVPPERATEILDEVYARGRPDDIWSVANARLQIFDFTWPGGVMPSEIVRDIANYRALRSAERWAEANLPLLVTR